MYNFEVTSFKGTKLSFLYDYCYIRRFDRKDICNIYNNS